MREPRVKNKYNLKPKDIENAIVLDYDRIHQSPFWRNDEIQAWCLSGDTCKGLKYFDHCSYDSYWIGFYDKDSKSYPGEIRLDCSAYGGMCDYNFKTFFSPLEIDCDIDLEIQEKLLSRINWLIDEGIIQIRK